MPTSKRPRCHKPRSDWGVDEKPLNSARKTPSVPPPKKEKARRKRKRSEVKKSQNLTHVGATQQKGNWGRKKDLCDEIAQKGLHSFTGGERSPLATPLSSRGVPGLKATKGEKIKKTGNPSTSLKHTGLLSNTSDQNWEKANIGLRWGRNCSRRYPTAVWWGKKKNSS